LAPRGNNILAHAEAQRRRGAEASRGGAGEFGGLGVNVRVAVIPNSKLLIF
jgi:hypothetical protein